MRKIVSIWVLLTASIVTWAVPASRQPIVRHLANGLTDTLFLYGDEHASFRTTTRNASLPRSLASAPQQVMRTAYVPTKGKVRIPVILVNFTDLAFTINSPKTQFSDFFNGNGGSNPNATGSVHTYYDASSNGQLDLEYVVFGPYTLSHDMAYYGANVTNSQGVTTNHNVRARELVIEATRLAYNSGVDFSSFDANNDNLIDNVSIVVAGYNEAEGGPKNSIWPHYSTISNGERFGSKYLCGYLMISEYRGSGGKTQAGIGTYCHEFGHALGLPDLYDTSDSERYTVGEWSVMCSGCYNNSGSTPPTYTAFERFIMGWLTPVQINSAGLRTLRPIEAYNEALLVASGQHNFNPLSPVPNEYFLLENRQAIGWDAGRDALVGTGMLISHITFSSYAWEYNTFNNSTPLGYAIVSAGVVDPTKSSAADIFPGSTRRSTWQPTLNNGTVLNDFVVSQIRQRADNDMSMYVGPIGDDVLAFTPEELVVTTSFLQKPIAYDTAVTMLHIPKTEEESLLLHMESGRFVYSIDSGAQWYSAGDTARITLLQDSSYHLPLLVVHTPIKQSCAYTYAFLTAETEDESLATQLTLKGTSPRPSLITPPVVDSAASVSTHSMTIYWEDQEEADAYFYSLYTLHTGTSKETEDFEQFATLTQIKESGWDANFANTQATISQSGYAVLCTQTGQYLQTPTYLYIPDHISLWLSNNYTPNGVDQTLGGQLIIRGSADGEEWKEITTINVQRTTKNITRTFELDTTQHMRQFRIEYTHLGGNGGTVIDTWNVYYPFTLQYIYPPRQYMTNGNNIRFRDLTPDTDYYFTLQAYDEKGCTPNYSDFSTPFRVHTKATPEDQHLIVKRNAPGLFTIVLPDMADGTYHMSIYDYSGRLVHRQNVYFGESTVDLPPLPLGYLYLVKYYKDTMKRKDLNTKILSH